MHVPQALSVLIQSEAILVFVSKDTNILITSVKVKNIKKFKES